jgi:hypothetical protein
MTYKDITDMLEEANLPLAYHHFAEGESPDPPFLIFLFPESDNFGADDKVYKAIKILHVELYTDKKDPALESALEKILSDHNIFFEIISETWIEEEKMYEVLYEMRIIYNAY